MLKRMNVEFLVTLEHDKIMPVALVIAEEEVLAMDGIYLLPVFESELDRRKRRMSVDFISESVPAEKVKDFRYSFFGSHHFARLLA